MALGNANGPGKYDDQGGAGRTTALILTKGDNVGPNVNGAANHRRELEKFVIRFGGSAPRQSLLSGRDTWTVD